MKKLKLKSIISGLLLAVSMLTICPIGASADIWKQNEYGKWYLLDDNGNYKRGWVQDGSNWYHISLTCIDVNCYVDGYYLSEKGIWTDSPTWNITTSAGKVITPESVKATADMYNKLLNEGWVNVFDCWHDNCATVHPKNRTDGAEYNTQCYIDSGIATIKYVTSCQSYDEFKNESFGNYVELTLEQYLKYKSEGKIGAFTYYAGANGNMGTVIQEYIINGEPVKLLNTEEQKEKFKEQSEDSEKKNEENRKKLEDAGYYLMN